MQHLRHFFEGKETYFLARPHTVDYQFVNIHPFTEQRSPGVATLPFSGFLPSLHTWLQLQPISQCSALPLSTLDPSSGDSNKESKKIGVINAMSLWQLCSGDSPKCLATLFGPHNQCFCSFSWCIPL